MLHYDRNISLNHVKRHLVETDDILHSVFNGIDIEDLFIRVERALPTAKKIQRFSFNDIYIFNYSRIGQNDCNKLQVITNKGSYEIVSMYPTKTNFKGFINDNLYDDYLNTITPKVKKMTQIEKFNNRYGIK